MDNHKEEFGMLQGCVPILERPAIVIIERKGDIEKTLEFATREDYTVYVSVNKQVDGERDVFSDLKSHGPIYQEIRKTITQIINS